MLQEVNATASSSVKVRVVLRKATAVVQTVVRTTVECRMLRPPPLLLLLLLLHGGRRHQLVWQCGGGLAPALIFKVKDKVKDGDQVADRLPLQVGVRVEKWAGGDGLGEFVLLGFGGHRLLKSFCLSVRRSVKRLGLIVKA